MTGSLWAAVHSGRRPQHGRRSPSGLCDANQELKTRLELIHKVCSILVLSRNCHRLPWRQRSKLLVDSRIYEWHLVDKFILESDSPSLAFHESFGHQASSHAIAVLLPLQRTYYSLHCILHVILCQRAQRWRKGEFLVVLRVRVCDAPA